MASNFITSFLDDHNVAHNISFQGEDFERIKHLDVTADEAERLQRKKKKKTPNEGFSDYEDATFR